MGRVIPDGSIAVRDVARGMNDVTGAADNDSFAREELDFTVEDEENFVFASVDVRRHTHAGWNDLLREKVCAAGVISIKFGDSRNTKDIEGDAFAGANEKDFLGGHNAPVILMNRSPSKPIEGP